MPVTYQMLWEPPMAGGPINGLVFGDSIGEGLAARLEAARPGDAWNEVSIGALMLHTTAGSGNGAILRFPGEGHAPFYLGGARNVVVFISISHGDLQDTSATPLDVVDGMATLISNAQALGWEVCVVSVPATTEYNDPLSSPYKRPERIAYNDLLRNGGSGRPIRAGAEHLADTDAIPGFGQADVPTSGPGGPYLDAGGVHLTDPVGKDAVAGRINLAIP